MRVGIGSDHLGFALKERLLLYLIQRGDSVHDFGTFCDEPVDYPDIAFPVAHAVRTGAVERGILVCGTGLGMAIAANKVPGVFAAPVTDPYMARLARQSNETQVLTLGANVIGSGLACEIVEAWLTADRRGGDSARKVAKIQRFEATGRADDAPRILAGALPCC
jgi:ribose 5-phosphate isomerase B